jgi:hypothetical protein
VIQQQQQQQLPMAVKSDPMIRKEVVMTMMNMMSKLKSKNVSYD